jgi:hypothetical protein
MKKLSVVVMVTFLSIFSLGEYVKAQSSSGTKLMFANERFVKSASNLTDADKLALEDIKWTNVRMHYDFTNGFKGATNIDVSHADYSILISCTIDGGFNRIKYSRKGKWQSTTRTYNNEKLDETVRVHIESLYSRYSIFGGVVEVRSGNKTFHLVTIEDKKSWKRIKVEDGESEVYEEYKKSQ